MNAKRLCIMGFSALIFFACGVFAAPRLPQLPPFFRDQVALNTTMELIRTRHMGAPVSNDALYYGAIKGIVATLNDDHSSFQEPREAKLEMDAEQGSFAGIGAALEDKDGKKAIKSVNAGSPAEKAGLRPGDVIESIDGAPTANLSVSDMVLKIRGAAGTAVALGIRSADGAPRTVVVTRAVILTPSVAWKQVWKNGRMAIVVTITHFGGDTEKLFAQVAADAVRYDAYGIVLDLRNNPGGHLTAAGAVACHWIADGPYVIMETRNEPPKRYPCTVDPDLEEVPLVVLVNGHSASASEVAAGALQDVQRGFVIGEKTFGKGVGQDVFLFRDGSRLKLVSFLWKTPLGRSINKEGIEPDELLVANPDDLAKGKDDQMDRAISKLLDDGC